jgi:hypothetical protein
MLVRDLGYKKALKVKHFACSLQEERNVVDTSIHLHI